MTTWSSWTPRGSRQTTEVRPATQRFPTLQMVTQTQRGGQRQSRAHTQSWGREDCPDPCTVAGAGRNPLVLGPKAESHHQWGCGRDDWPVPRPSGPAGPTCPLQRDLHGPAILERVERLKQDLLAKVLVLGRELPVNTLDELIDQLGGPERVAEVSSVAAPPGPGLWLPLAATPSSC